MLRFKASLARITQSRDGAHHPEIVEAAHTAPDDALPEPAWLSRYVRPRDETDQDGGVAIQEFVVAELTEERARRVRIDSQGASLITGSTALSAVAFAAAALVTNQDGFVLPRLSVWALAMTFVAFMFAAFCGLRGGGVIHDNEVVPMEDLEDMLHDNSSWLEEKSEVSRKLLDPILGYLNDVREFNARRAQWVIRGSWSQIVALTGLSIAVGAILLKAMVPNMVGWFDVLSRVQ